MSYVDRRDFYEFNKPEKKEQTRKRLQQLSDLGMEELGIASFGIPDIISGIYIEHVWSHSEQQWNDYVTWMKKLITNNKLK